MFYSRIKVMWWWIWICFSELWVQFCILYIFVFRHGHSFKSAFPAGLCADCISRTCVKPWERDWWSNQASLPSLQRDLQTTVHSNAEYKMIWGFTAPWSMQTMANTTFHNSCCTCCHVGCVNVYSAWYKFPSSYSILSAKKSLWHVLLSKLR